MENYIQPGVVLDLPIAAKTAGGSPVCVGDITGVLVKSVEAGEVGVVNTEGVYALTATAAAPIAVGTKIYIKSDKSLTTEDAGNTLYGYSLSVLASGDGEINIKLK